MNNVDDMTAAEFEQRLNRDKAKLEVHERDVDEYRLEAMKNIMALASLPLPPESFVEELRTVARLNKFRQKMLAKAYKDTDEAFTEYKKKLFGVSQKD